ncbi:sigma-54-dependent transcriptional regulator [Verrucomicrobiota bacterium]
MGKGRVLIVEDDPDGRRSVGEALEDGGFEVETAVAGEDGVRRFREGAFDAVLSDLVLPDIDGIEVLNRVQKLSRQVPVLIMTAYGSVSTAVDALKSGAYDYITKPLDLDDLQAKVGRAVDTRRRRADIDRVHESALQRYSAGAMVANSPAMEAVVARIANLADTSATVLIEGESGTGKELVARALHVDGRRGPGPFVAVNCGAFAESLLESELFGHEKGSFTGAIARRKGAFERADTGTLFLDEVGNAPPSVQVKLLRVLEERQVVRVGGQDVVPVDVRLVSATNRNLHDLARAGEFRDDLLYRLEVVTIRLPPLRERREDIRPLTDRFVAAACEEHDRTINSIDPSCYDALERFDWPGNVRQLRNVMEASVIMAPGGSLRENDLQLDQNRGRQKEQGNVPEDMTLAELERQALLQALRAHDGNRTAVARKLGISRRTIQRKIQEYDLPF